MALSHKKSRMYYDKVHLRYWLNGQEILACFQIYLWSFKLVKIPFFMTFKLTCQAITIMSSFYENPSVLDMLIQ